MPIDFTRLTVGRAYDRPELARLWGYKGYEAIGRGVVTPAGQNTIILFITEQQQPALPQYQNRFDGELLWMDGEEGHRSDRRLTNTPNRDTVHLFHRERDHSPFRYCGEVSLVNSFLVTGPGRSRFVFTARPQSVDEAEEALRAQQSLDGDEPFEPDTEGRRLLRLHTVYERSKKNRERALAIHGSICVVCGFDFDLAYGADLARSYIEVHHVRSITDIKGEVVDPDRDLAPVCANCHRMAHRRHGVIVPLDELRRRMHDARIRQDHG